MVAFGNLGGLWLLNNWILFVFNSNSMPFGWLLLVCGGITELGLACTFGFVILDDFVSFDLNFEFDFLVKLEPWFCLDFLSSFELNPALVALLQVSQPSAVVLTIQGIISVTRAKMPG